MPPEPQQILGNLPLPGIVGKPNRVRYRDYSPRHLISERVFDRLMAIYEHDVRELEQAEGRELSAWFDFASLDPSIRAPGGSAG